MVQLSVPYYLIPIPANVLILETGSCLMKNGVLLLAYVRPRLQDPVDAVERTLLGETSLSLCIGDGPLKLEFASRISL